MWTSLLFSSLLTAHAAPSPWQLSAERPPTATVDPERFFFPQADQTLRVLPAVVLTLAPDTVPPVGAQHLGGVSYRLPMASPEAAIEAALLWAGRDGVDTAWPDVILPRVRAAVSFDDPHYPGQWYLEELDAQVMFDRSLGDPAIRVAVIDSGIDINHPDLVDAVDDPYDAWSDDDDPSPNPGEYCFDGDGICDDHGTAVAGVVAARANNSEGIVGLCPACTLIPIKLLGDGDDGRLSADIAAFEHAIAADAAVINNSWGFVESIPVPQPLADVIDRAATEPRGGLGAVVIFAAGNDNREIADNELQALTSVLCVSATDRYGQPTAYTNQGDSVDVSAPSATVTIAPGQDVLTTFGGTSAAAPVVSGMAAWALSVRPELSAEDLRQVLIDAAQPSPIVTHDEDGHHPIYGYGEISGQALVDALFTDAPADEPADEPAAGGCHIAAAAPASSMILALSAGLVGRRRRR
ncbi:MAG: S8 family serine peptidase [Myxococcota bacterium]